MGREWKPGDVAMVRLDPETEIRVMYNGACWVGRKGTFYDLHASARPLVVIDPEDREQAERLRDAIDKSGTRLYGWQHIQAALREFANPMPPKPDEPTGLGAVVEDSDGHRWVRVDDPHHSWVRSLRDEGAYTQRSKWEQIDVTAVLSAGWSA